MTDVLAMTTSDEAAARPARILPRLNPFALWISSILIYFAPRKVAFRWRSASLPAAAGVAVFNLLLLVPWTAFVAACWIALDNHLLRQGIIGSGPFVAHPLEAFLGIFPKLPGNLDSIIHQLNRSERLGFAGSTLLSILSFLIISFFVLLPFAARPGNNKACIRHTARSVLLATGCIHLFAPLIGGTLLMLVVFKTAPGFENAMTPLFLLLSILVLWTLNALIRAVRTDYREPRHLPQPKDPTCDFCGYDLRAAAPGGRCPECGKLVQESLGAQNRQSTAWEKHPSFRRIAIVLAQLRTLIFAPRSLFYAMPTRDGQLAAQHWLLGSIALVGFIAFWIVPGLWVVRLIDQWWNGLLAGGLALAVVWAILALMMVGIETLGVVTYGRFHGMKIELAAAAKATCYSSTLMSFWVVLGGLQILGLAAFWQFGLAHHFSVAYTPRVTEAISVGSLAIAHICGLLWFELTVYRGVRAFQYANR